MTDGKPQRIQRKRARGWKMPANTIYVGRPSLFGNPFKVEDYGERGAVEAFRVYVEHHRDGMAMATFAQSFLEGKNLCCWCRPDRPCHADILLDIANS